MPSQPNLLSRLLQEADGSGTPVAFGRDGVHSLADLVADVSALAARIEAEGRGRWLFFTDDSYAAAVGLLALSATQSVAVLPPNQQPGALARLARGTVGALVDDASDAVADLPTLTPLGPRPQLPGPPPKLDRDAPLLEFQTSGTTGDPRPVSKSLRHLEDEVRILEERLGHRIPEDTRVFATASHQHIYGLLFRVLWPLAAGRPFQSETLLHSQELLPRMTACESVVLVTTPVHLKRLAGSGRLRELRGGCRAVYSSGGPLDPDTAMAVADQLGEAPIEIFGSTETGGIATRQRDRDGEIWYPLPSVEIARRESDGCLEVTSPFVSVGEDAGAGRSRTSLGDRIELATDHGFRLLGRIDRTVKVGEKRLSLPDMEQALVAHAGIAECALLVLEHAGERRVHAVVVPSPDGRELLEANGRHAFRSMLSRSLADRFDPVLLPRAWRFVDALPRNPQDKLPQASLQALFGDRGATPPREPTLLAERREAERLTRELDIPEDLAQLDGHFDDFPIVAGVVQLGWVLDAAAAWFGCSPQLEGLDALKFPEPLRPGRRVNLEIERASEGRVLRFRLFAEETVFATGRALLCAPLIAGAE